VLFSMKTKMTLAVFLLVSFLMSVTAVTSLLYFEKKFKQSISHQQWTLLNSVATQIDDRIFEFMVDLDTLADAVTPQLLDDPARAQRLLDDQKRQRVFFDNSLFLFSRSGTMIAASPKDLNFIGKDFSFRDYFRETMATGRICVSPPFASIQKESHPIIMFTAPVYDSRNRIIGVVGGSVDLRKQHYLRSLAALKLGQNGFLSLYDSQRNVLMHPDRKLVLLRDPPGTNPMLDQALAGFEGTGESRTRSGVPVLRSVKKLQSTSWVLAVSYPLSDAYAPLRTARYYFVAGSLAAALMSLLIVWLFMRYLTRPLLSFTRHLEKLPGLEGEARLAPVGSKDEMGQMAETFNRMILELEQREVALQEQKEFAESLVLNSSLPTFVIDCGHRVLFWNKACEELTGVKAADLVGTDRHWAAFHAEKSSTLADVIIDGTVETMSVPDMKCERSHLLRSGWHCEGWYERLNGTDRYVFLDAAPIRNDKGETVAAIQTIRDFTDLKQAELDLERSRDFYLQSEERYRQLFEDNPHPMWAHAVDTDAFLAVNHAAIRHYGYSEQEFLSMTVNDLMPNEEAHPVPRAPGAKGELVPLRRHLRKDGSVILVETSSHVMDFAGVQAEIVLAHDVTERVRAEQEKVALEHQLTQSQKMEAIGTLTGGIAHDFNNILTAIIGYATMIQLELEEQSPLQRKVGEILRASDRAANLTRSLLAYSRRQVSNPAPVGVNSIIGNVEILLRRLIPENIELKTQLCRDELPIMADSGQLEQVVMNLVVNARDAMRDGGVLRIATEPITLSHDFIAAHGYGKPGDFVLMTVTDSGVGMDEKTRERIFEPFFTTKEPGKGTGLGLAMVYGIVKQHGGFINCYSELGHGTVFRIYLPLTESAAREEAPPPDREVRGGDETILLVEDDAVIRDMIGELLEDFGYTVIMAVNGEDAVQKFKEAASAVLLVILDVIMPRMNGREACDAISALSPGVKVLFMSGYTADIVSDSSIKGDPRHFVPKPIQIDEMLTKVRNLLDE